MNGNTSLWWWKLYEIALRNTSGRTILDNYFKNAGAFAEAFDNFDVIMIADYDQRKIEELLTIRK